MKTAGQRILKLLGGQYFSIKAPVTLTFDLKIKRGHLLIMTNLHAKYEDCVSKESQVIGQIRKKPPAGQPDGQADSSIQLCCAGV
jgi:hypothetical protein